MCQMFLTKIMLESDLSEYVLQPDGIRALTWLRTGSHPKGWCVRVWDLHGLLYCAIECELILYRQHFVLITVLNNGVWVGPYQDVLGYVAATFTDKVFLIIARTLQGSLFLFKSFLKAVF